MGYGPIPWRDAVDYADRCGLEPDVRELFVEVIRRMDDAWLKWQAEEQERRRKQREPEPSRQKKV